MPQITAETLWFSREIYFFESNNDAAWRLNAAGSQNKREGTRIKGSRVRKLRGMRGDCIVLFGLYICTYLLHFSRQDNLHVFVMNFLRMYKDVLEIARVIIYVYVLFYFKYNN